MADDSLSASMFGIPYFGAGASALGLGGDIFSFIQNLQRQQAIQKIYDMLSNPQKLAGYAGSLMPQYSPAAVGAFNRGVNADWASLTGGAPGGAAAQFGADAWAKLISQNWGNALNAALGGLGRASTTGQALPTSPLGGLGTILQRLATLKQLQGGSQPGITSGFPGVSSSDQVRSQVPVDVSAGDIGSYS